MLQTRLGQTNVAGMAQTTTPDALLMGTFDPGTRFVRLLELGRFLTPSGSMQRFIFLLGLQHQLAGFGLGAGAVATILTGVAIFLGKTDVPGTAFGLRLRAWPERQAGLAGRAGHGLRLPIHDKASLVEAFARLQLPTKASRNNYRLI